jgi:hypothetical protein
MARQTTTVVPRASDKDAEEPQRSSSAKKLPSEAPMKRSLAVLLLLLTLSRSTFAQTSPKTPAPEPSLSARVPPANPDDVKSLDAILRAVYNVISGPAGERDWNRFRSLFAPQARLTSTTKESATHPVRLLSVDDYINLAGGYFNTHGFFESAIVNRVQKFGSIAQVFSSYESRNALTEKPFARGINSIQLFNDGTRWWVLSILWDEESPTTPLPPEMASKPSSPISE